ncbi:MAG: Protein GrpE [Alphaproteobacteria bacterium MarineAlpha5_Bin2]|jgi:molecular chaperone GrpE|nr:MAG: Protein GrpE [Alphaproteobacteria bacterium MarineAlpha5_Bin2]PPR56946.1 MAG: Protein GrpE [Alphaproteobacteria bacterium MarineAlpha5_Bin3]HIC41645.1 nucleotide exchange factor GrpE [Pelagibacterales bacterium]
MSKKNKAKLNKEDELEKNNSDIVNSESENLEQNSTVANDTDADNEKQNELEENLRDEIEQLRDEKLRLLADMENLRKRSDRDRMDSIRYGNINFARDILSLGDNLSRALDAIPKDAEKTETITNLINGLRMVQREFTSILEKHGIKKIEALNQRFDHNFHQAMMEIESEEVEEGIVIQEIQSGYNMHDRLLRPSMVGVAKKPNKDEKKK